MTKEDCISREAVNVLVDELARAISDERCCISRGRSTTNIMEDILDLPPLTPQPKIGQWIKVDDEEPIAYDCSECTAMVSRKYKYCPNCGSKMESEENSNDK